MKKIAYIVPCHRIPERCLHIKGEPMPICTRCFAILIGYLCLPFTLLFSNIPLWVPILLSLPMIIDGFTQRWKWRESNNLLRFITGLLFGIGQTTVISIVIWSVVRLIS
nr:DUF2085 domain-containing protein [Lysinibacillus timonensis]